MSNLAEELPLEIKRNQELKEIYRDIPTGFIGASMIQLDIDLAVKAIADGDVIAMLRAYETLKGNE
jgi:hypothetical protein